MALMVVSDLKGNTLKCGCQGEEKTRIIIKIIKSGQRKIVDMETLFTLICC